MKIGRNDPCLCGSGKKYKKCCLLKEQNEQNSMIESNLKSEIQQNKDEYDDDELDLSEIFFKAAINMHEFSLKNKPHIKEYKKIRKLHEEVVGNMVNYWENGKFEHKFDTKDILGNEIDTSSVMFLDSEFDMESREGAHAFYDMLIYKMTPNANCITEEFIKIHRYRKPEKIEFLENMLDSELGLFEVTAIDSKEGYAYIKEVFTGKEFKMTDIGLSYNKNYDTTYIYARIITYHDVSFGTGFSLFFDKEDEFIKNHINRHKKDYTPLGEFMRFTELYNRFSKDPKGMRVIEHHR